MPIASAPHTTTAISGRPSPGFGTDAEIGFLDRAGIAGANHAEIARNCEIRVARLSAICTIGSRRCVTQCVRIMSRDKIRESRPIGRRDEICNDHEVRQERQIGGYGQIRQYG